MTQVDAVFELWNLFENMTLNVNHNFIGISTFKGEEMHLYKL
jgi:hypothetical protein